MDRHVATQIDVDVFESLPVLTVLAGVDEEGVPVIEDCNDRFARRIGRPRAALRGRPLRSVYATSAARDSEAARPSEAVSTSDGGVDVDYPESPGAPVERGSDGGETDAADRVIGGDARDDPCADPSDLVERRLVCADGSLVHTVAEAIPRDDGRYLLCHLDVTRRKRREKQADVLNRLMRHNVRNDLNLLRGYARTLADHDDEAVVDAAEVIDRIADRWLGLAGKARQIERLFDSDAEPVPIGELAGAARATVERDWSVGRVELELDVDPESHVSERLHVALVELCENAIKHAAAAADVDDGRDERSIRATLTVEPGLEPGWITVRVADEGPGIPPHELAAVRRDTETPLQHGSGLGFWLVRFVVQQLGGVVSARADQGEGSVVTLDVPLADERDPPAR